MIWLLAALCVLVAAAIVLLVVGWRRVLTELAWQRTVLVGLARPAPDSSTLPAVNIVKEAPPMDAQSSLAFYQRLGGLAEWPTLAAKFQAATREYLIRARLAADDGKAEAGWMAVGVAWYAAQLAILPESEVQAAVAGLKQAAMEQEMAAMLSQGSPRPSRH